MRGKQIQPTVEIQLFRGGSVVSSFTGAFGATLKETRLTALLGYLIALEPEKFMEQFGFKGKAMSVSLETVEGNDRSDICIETTKGRGVIEAKVDTTDPFDQCSRYSCNWRVLLTQYIPPPHRQKLAGIKYLQWKHLADLLKELSHSSNNKIKFVSNDLLTYLEEHNMLKNTETSEVYAREINEPLSLKLFLKAQMYGCDFQNSDRLGEARYFAPHFGQAIADEYPGIQAGISYIAKIEDIVTIESWEDVVEATRTKRGTVWLNRHKGVMEPIHKAWTFAGVKHSFLFLATPRLVFNPSIRKKNIQSQAGILVKRFFSFDELFKVWGC